MRKVSYKTVLRDLYEDTELQKKKIDEIYLTRLIRKADKRIEGLYTVNVSKMVVAIENSIVPLPSDAFNIDYVLLGDYSDENAYFINNNEDFIINIEAIDNSYVNLDASTTNITNYYLWSDISYPIQKNKIDFVLSNGEINIDPVYNGETVTVIYTCYPKNDKGEFMINENHVDPIIAWVKHHVFEREIYRRKMSGNRLGNDDFGFLRQLKSDKNLLIRNARVQDRNLNADYLNKNVPVSYYNIMIENDIY